MTYQEAIEFLHQLRWFGAKFGLENTLKLAALAGNPHERLRFIHVAGTNGKGSTCAMLECIYRAAGLRTGLFTSPHLVAFGERVQVNRQLIPESEIARWVEEMRRLVEQGWPKGGETHPTFFEVVTVMALRYFEEQKCDLVIWETGLGGRLDATNIVTPLVSVITNIQYDHQKWLGETLARIAAEKAGIIKRGVPVITGAQNPEALAVIEARARAQTAPLTVVTPAETKRPPLDTLELPLPGEHQRMNAAVALAATRVLESTVPVSEDAVRSGLLRLHWPGRLQWIERPSGQKVLLDGAHNPAGAEVLATALKECSLPVKTALVLGILGDKDWEAMGERLAPLAGRILLVPVASERTAEPGALAEVCRRANPQAHVGIYPSLAAALSEAEGERFITITGSLYLVGEAMEILGLFPAPPAAERLLNEWTGKEIR